MGTLRSLGALARAVGPVVAASGEAVVRHSGHAGGPARPGLGVLLGELEGAGGPGAPSPPPLSPQRTGWPAPVSVTPCARRSSCSPSPSCGP